MAKIKEYPVLREGSVKQILRIGNDIGFRFTSDFSVFDIGKYPRPIPGKAEAICACAVKSFEIAQAIGVPTNFIEQIDSVTVLVKETQIITDRYLTLEDENYLVPSEWIYRLRVSGSILRDFKSGKKNPVDYGLPSGVPVEGTPFPSPVHMFTTKFEKTDREITEEEALKMAGITKKDELEYWSMMDRLTGAIALRLFEVGFALVDGKMEVIMGIGRRKMIGDVFGTPDEDRFCPLAALEAGQVEHYSKEYLRQLFIANGFYEQLQAARKDNQPDPPWKMLSKDELAEASRRYIEVAEAYSGQKIEYSA